MSASGGSPREMPDLPRFGTRQLPDATSAEGLLAGRGAAPGAPAGQQDLARLLEIAAGPATSQELAGEAAAVTAFARVTSLAGSRRVGARPRTVPASRTPARCALARRALALVACISALGGTAAAARALPAPVQELAHVMFGAPAPRHDVLVPRPGGGSPSQPGRQGIPAMGQPGQQKARGQGQEAHPGGTAKDRPGLQGRRAHPHGQPGHQETSPKGHPSSQPNVSQGHLADR
jgi:hypothetical protein